MVACDSLHYEHYSTLVLLHFDIPAVHTLSVPQLIKLVVLFLFQFLLLSYEGPLFLF